MRQGRPGFQHGDSANWAGGNHPDRLWRAECGEALHIGHLRSAIIGEALKRIARACGYRVIGDIHLGDWGLQIGLVIAELSDRHPEWRCFASDFEAERESAPPLDPDTLSEVYPFANARSKEDPAFRERAKQATVKLQEGHAGYRACGGS